MAVRNCPIPIKAAAKLARAFPHTRGESRVSIREHPTQPSARISADTHPDRTSLFSFFIGWRTTLVESANNFRNERETCNSSRDCFVGTRFVGVCCGLFCWCWATEVRSFGFWRLEVLGLTICVLLRKWKTVRLMFSVIALVMLGLWMYVVVCSTGVGITEVCVFRFWKLKTKD